MLEGGVQLLIECHIQEGQCGFRPGRGTMVQLHVLVRILEWAWEFAQPGFGFYGSGEG